MGPRLRPRLLDLAVALVCAALVAAPWIAGVGVAATTSTAPIIESAGSVDQAVASALTISDPVTASVTMSRARTSVNGAATWQYSTNAGKGAKLTVSAGRAPAMRDPQQGLDIPDFDASPARWSVERGQSRFGFSATGDLVLDRYGDGSRWRGFDGPVSIEVGRLGAPVRPSSTTVKFAAAFGSPMPRDARPGATIEATVVGNL